MGLEGMGQGRKWSGGVLLDDEPLALCSIIEPQKKMGGFVCRNENGSAL